MIRTPGEATLGESKLRAMATPVDSDTSSLLVPRLPSLSPASFFSSDSIRQLSSLIAFLRPQISGDFAPLGDDDNFDGAVLPDDIVKSQF